MSVAGLAKRSELELQVSLVATWLCSTLMSRSRNSALSWRFAATTATPKDCNLKRFPRLSKRNRCDVKNCYDGGKFFLRASDAPISSKARKNIMEQAFWSLLVPTW